MPISEIAFLSPALIFFIFLATILLSYEIVFELFSSFSQRRSVFNINFLSKIFVHRVRTTLEELSSYTVAGLFTIFISLLIFMTAIFSSFYLLTWDSNIDIYSIFFPASLGFLILFLCKLSILNDHIFTVKSYQSIFVYVLCLLLMLLSLTFIYFLKPDTFILTEIRFSENNASLLKLFPSTLILIISGYFILNEFKTTDEVSFGRSIIGKLFYYFFLLYLSLYVIMLVGVNPFFNFSSLTENWVSSNNLLTGIIGFNNFTVLKVLILWIFLVLVSILIAWINSLIPRMNLKYRLLSVVLLCSPFLIINFIYLFVF